MASDQVRDVVRVMCVQTKPVLRIALMGYLLSCSSFPVLAQTVTWNSPGGGSWFVPGNWTPAGVPTSANNAIIDNSTATVTIDGGVAPQASSLSISGNTVVSVSVPDISGLNAITLTGAGANLNTTLTSLDMTGSSSAGSVSINAVGQNLSTYLDGAVRFLDTSTAANAILTASNQGQFDFAGNSTAGNATITVNAGGQVGFEENASAGTSRITNNAGGLVVFGMFSTGNTATVINNAGGVVDISYSAVEFLGPGFTTGNGFVNIGSLSGAGNVFLGESQLILGNLGGNDVISGVISDGMSSQFNAYASVLLGAPPLAFTGGSINKVGSGTLTLTGINTYTGGTTITGGVLAIGADSAIGAAMGPLTFNGGTLRFNSQFDLAATRAITLNAPGGTIDTNGFTTTIAQGMAGPGGLGVTGAGTLVLAGPNTYAGTTTIASATTLRAAAVNSFSPNSAVILAPAATLALAGFNQTVAGLTNAGLAQLNAPGAAPGTLLTVNGNYIGQGGTIALNTFLGGDASASDRLVINGGHASGDTGLLITNVGGPGAATMQGIQVVQAINGGTTDANAFRLTNRVTAGAFEYQLNRTGENWYLQSFLTPTPPQEPGPPRRAFRPHYPALQAGGGSLRADTSTWPLDECNDAGHAA